jgi:hypothetical protein
VVAAGELEDAGIPTYCSAVAWAEIYAGIRAGEEPVTQAFFEARGEVVLDSLVGLRAGAYLARYARSNSLELGDALVAAAATTSDSNSGRGTESTIPCPTCVFTSPSAVSNSTAAGRKSRLGEAGKSTVGLLKPHQKFEWALDGCGSFALRSETTTASQ